MEEQKRTNRRGWIYGAALVLTALLLTLGLWRSRVHAKQWQEETSIQFLMDTVVDFQFYGGHARQGIDSCEGALRQMERDLSLYREDSQIARVNGAAGESPVEVGAEVFSLVRRAKELSLLSEGQFDLTVAPLSRLWIVMGEDPHVPPEEEIAAKRELLGCSRVALDEARRTVFLEQAGMEIDLGGIAKGYAAGRCLELLREAGVENGYLSIGGNVAAIGTDPEGDPMRFGIRNPRGSGPSYIGSLTVQDAVLATSGDYERYFEEDGVRYHHILDPVTGYPARSGLISVSVLSKDGTEADFLSTALFVGGVSRLDAFRDQLDYEYVAVDEEYRVYVSEGLRDDFELRPDATEYHLAEAGA